jgi:SAM-dependent methyltransferase
MQQRQQRDRDDGGPAFANRRAMATMTTEPDAQPQLRRAVETWERAEIRRSAVEADLTPDSSLKVGPRTFARYLAPPADTPYPLEYCYHLLGDVRGRRVVDFGCGSGANTVLLANRGADVWGVDISADLIRLAERRLAVNGRAGGARFVVASAHDLPFPDGSVDVLFGIAILHHLDLHLVSREVHRVLRPGGRAIFQEPVRNSRAVRAIRALIPHRAPDVSPFERPLTDEELKAFAAPFAEMRVRAFGLPHVALGQVVPFIRRRVNRLYRLDAALLRRFPSLTHFAGIRVVEARRK